MTGRHDGASIARRLDPLLLRHWRFILVAAEEGSFRRAADRLGVQQSTLSRRIRDIEDAMGATLFARTHAGVKPTFAGHRLLGPAREILAQASRAALEVDRAGSAQDGLLRIGLPTAPGGRLTRLLHRFVQICPRVRIDLVDGESASQLRAGIRRHELDVVIQAGARSADGSEALTLWDEAILVAMPEGDPLAAPERLSLADLGMRHFIFRAADPALVSFHTMLASPLSANVTISTRPITREASLLQLVALGHGLTLTTDPAACQPSVLHRPLDGRWLPVVAIWLRSNPNPALARLLSLARQMRSPRAHTRISSA